MGDTSKHLVIGVDVGGTKIAGAVVSEDLVVHARAHRVSLGASQNELLNMIVDMIGELRDGSEQPIEAVGLGIPSLMDHTSGSAIMSVNLPLADVPVRDLISERVGLPVAVDNDANVAALAEQRFGAARGKKHVILLTLGTGVGGGVIIDGHIFRGATGSGAELGHVTVNANGPRCQGNCQSFGCLETMVSGTALALDAAAAATRNPKSRLAQLRAQGHELTGEAVTRLAQEGDPESVELLFQAGVYLGAGIVSLVNIFNPEMVVIGGGAAAAGDLILAPAREVLRERGLSPNKDLCEIVPAYFGADAGMLGAAVLAMDECLED